MAVQDPVAAAVLDEEAPGVAGIPFKLPIVDRAPRRLSTACVLVAGG